MDGWMEGCIGKVYVDEWMDGWGGEGVMWGSPLLAVPPLGLHPAPLQREDAAAEPGAALKKIIGK